MRTPGFETALELASPVLADRVHQMCDGRKLPEPAARRVVQSVLRYVLRASGRATPFGLFAGMAPARIAELPDFRAGAAHLVAARVDAGWLAAVIDRLEADPALRPRLTAVASDLAFERDGYLVLEHRPSPAVGAPAHVRVRGTQPTLAAMNLARSPIRLSDLAAKLADAFPGVPAPLVDRLLADLVAQHYFVTNLRAPMTVTDPLDYLIRELQAAAAREIPGVADTLSGLPETADTLRRLQDMTSLNDIRRHRARLTAATTRLQVKPEPRIAVDLRVDMDVVVPHAVAAEAARAARVLAHLAPQPGLSPGWAAWHLRFLERYGPLPEHVSARADFGPETQAANLLACHVPVCRSAILLAQMAGIRVSAGWMASVGGKGRRAGGLQRVHGAGRRAAEDRPGGARGRDPGPGRRGHPLCAPGVYPLPQPPAHRHPLR